MIWIGPLAGLSTALALLFVLYGSTVAATVNTWSGSEAYRFLFLVPFISAYFIWLRRHVIAVLSPQATPIAIVPLAAFGLLWLIAHAALVNIGEQLAWVGMLQALVLAFLGWRICRALLFPLMLLWLMVPVGDVLTAELMEMTLAGTVWGLRLLGGDVTSEGTLLITASGRYAVVRECAALPFIVGNLIIGLVFANLMFEGLGKRVVYVLAGIPVAVLANLLRTTSVVFITEVSDGRVDLASDHAVYGWFVFAGAVAAQMAVGMRFADARAQGETRVSGGRLRHWPFRHLILMVLTTSVLASAPRAWAHWRFEATAVARADPGCLVPGLPGTEIPAPAWYPHFPAADLALHRMIGSGGAEVDLFIAFYADQKAGKKLVGWPNHAFDARRWMYLQRLDPDWDSVAGMPAPEALRLRGVDRRGRRHVWLWYWVDGRFTGSAYAAKVWQAKAAIVGGNRRGGVLILSAAESDARADPTAAMHRALSDLQVPGALMERVERAVVSGDCAATDPA